MGNAKRKQVQDSPDEHENQESSPGRASVKSTGPGLVDMISGNEPADDNSLSAKSSSIIKFYPNCCSCFRRDPYQLGPSPTVNERCKSFWRCPPQGLLGRLINCLLVGVFIWGFAFYIFKPMSLNNITGHPDHDLNPAWIYGPLFALGVIEVTGLLFGVMLKRFLNLPPLLGPLLLGIFYFNVKPINLFYLMVSRPVRITCPNAWIPSRSCQQAMSFDMNAWIKQIRLIALGIILTRAGVELSPKQLMKLKGIVPALAFTPCVVEALTCGGISYVFFNVLESRPQYKMDIAMCFTAGFALAAVSPAVVVPGALSLSKAGYGVTKGIPTLLIAAASIDDVLAISIYTICLGLAIQGTGEQWKSYTGGVIGIAVGIAHGFVAGIILHFIPSRFSKYKAHNRLMLLLLINFVSLLAYEETFYNGAGSISVLATSMVASFGWRSQPHWKKPMEEMEKVLSHMWVLWVPLIFGTIGKEINFLSAPFKYPHILKILGVIFISVCIRCLAAFIVVSIRTGFNKKERLLIALSWIPKATVQAALAPLVLSRAQAGGNSGILYNAEIVVNIAIIAVLITAPAGCIMIACLGPRLLEKATPKQVRDSRDDEFPNGEGEEQEDLEGQDPLQSGSSLEPTPAQSYA